MSKSSKRDERVEDAPPPVIERPELAPVVIKPFVSAGEAFIAPDGSVHKVILSVFRNSHGGCTLRIGETIYVFDADGTYDGPEVHLRDASKLPQVQKLLEEGSKSRGVVPANTYFEPGSRGWECETAVYGTGKGVMADPYVIGANRGKRPVKPS